MVDSNKEILRKADLALTDLTTAGVLNPEQTDLFIRVLIDSPTIMNVARIITMNAPTKKINKIGFGSRILQAANQGALNTWGAGSRGPTRTKPTTSQIVMNTSEVIAEVDIPYEVLEDNIEGGNIAVPLQGSPGGLHETLVQLIAQRAALDLEELSLAGDTTSADPYLALMDGFIKMMNANVVNCGAATLSKNLVKQAVKAMPPKYLRNRADLAHFFSVQQETEYRDTYANRNTALGDAMLQGTSPVYAFGSPVQGVPLMPQSTGLFTNPLNLIFGFQRRITIEYDKDIRQRSFIIVVTARVAMAIEETNAGVKYTNIGS